MKLSVTSCKQKHSGDLESQQDEATSEPDIKHQLIKSIELKLLRAINSDADIISCSTTPLDEREKHFAFMRACLGYYREVVSISDHSIHIRLTVPTLEALDDLYRKCVTGFLKQAFCTEFITAEFLSECGLESVDISIHMDQTEYQRLRSLLQGD